MKRITALFLAAVLLLSLAACGAKDAWQEQYDLGMRYLNDGNYEEAVIAFTAAIEIDPKRSEAYLGAAEAYIAADDIDAAITILEKGYAATNNDTLKKRLDEIKSGTFSDYWGRTRRESHYDGAGNLMYWATYEYNDAEDKTLCTGFTSYNSRGEQVQHFDRKFNEQGKCVYDVAGWRDDGTMIGETLIYNEKGQLMRVPDDESQNIMVYSYNEEGKTIRIEHYDRKENLLSYNDIEYGSDYKRSSKYDANGILNGYYIEYYNQQGKCIRGENYNKDGILISYNTLEYDADGKLIANNRYDADGTLNSRTTFQ